MSGGAGSARRAAPRPKPVPAALPSGWSWFANGPLRGAGLLRERQWIYAWDDGNTIYLLNLQGELVAQKRAPESLVALAGADNGEALVALSRAGRLWWLSTELEVRRELQVPSGAAGLAVDPHGEYAAVGCDLGRNFLCDANGKKIADFFTPRPARYFAFVPLDGTVVSASEDGELFCHDFAGGQVWQARQPSNVGGLALDGAGEVVLLACFGHGLVRFGAGGKREGTYRFDQSPALVAVDFEGSRIVTASLEGRLTELSYSGTIRAERAIQERPAALAIDALGRYLVLAFPQGELRYLSVEEAFSDSATPLARAGSGSEIAQAVPAWEVRATDREEETRSAILAPVPGTRHVALFSDRKTLRILDERGELTHESVPLQGVGRTVVASDRWLAAATDRTLLGYDPESNRSIRASISAIEVSNLELFAEFGDLMVIESCEYLTRLRLPEEVVWKKRLAYQVHSAAVRPSGEVALVLDDQNLIVLGPQGERIGKFRARPSEPLSVVAARDGWATAAREATALRGHEVDGRLLWATSLPFRPWTVRRLGDLFLATSEEGKSALVSPDGELIAENSEPRAGSRYFVRADGKVARVFVSGSSVLATTFSGRLWWRHEDEHRIGEFAASEAGLWVFLGKMLTFFAFEP